MAKLTNYRWTLWRSQFFSSLSTSLFVFVVTQIWFLLFPYAYGFVLGTIIFIGCFFFSLVTGIVFSYRESKEFKRRFEDIAAFIRILSRGKLSQRMEVTSMDEAGDIERSLNELADKLETQVNSLQRLADKNADLTHQARQAAIIEERQRLARDLHDAISQQLFALNMMTSAAIRTIAQKPEAALKQMNEVASMASKAQGEMRALLLHLRPIQLSGEPLHIGMTKLISELSEKTDLQFEMEIDEINDLSHGIEDHLFRILQEALSNALRHSRAEKITVKLKTYEDVITLHVRDNVKGFDIDERKKTSYGLKTMEERCREIGGTFTITTKQDQGTSIDIRIPI